MREAESELSQKIVSRKKAFDSMLLVARVVEDERRRRPLRAEARSKLLELLGLVLHVHAYRHEMRADNLGDPGIGVHLGIQPSTPCSKRCAAEVEQHVHVATSCLLERHAQV